ncbi:MAG: hypothetical protein H7256_00155 [Bdellovibrio sp.]|nr:hypothetical protein [Bdellovibrio sp.]
MKLLVLSISLFSSLSFAADHAIEQGLYSAIDVDTQTIVSSLEIGADSSVTFKVNTPDFSMPEPGCKGTYAVAGDVLTADMKCPLDFLSQVQVVIDIKNVTADSVRSPNGVVVQVVIDALGSDAYPFILKKIDAKKN